MALTLIPYRNSTLYFVSPSDTDEFSTRPRALFIAGAGNIVVKFDSEDLITHAVGAGQTVNISPRVVMATDTTATGIIAIA